MARQSRRRAGDAAAFRDLPEAESRGGEGVRRGQGDAVQAIPGVGRGEGPGAGGEEVAEGVAGSGFRVVLAKRTTPEGVANATAQLRPSPPPHPPPPPPPPPTLPPP